MSAHEQMSMHSPDLPPHANCKTRYAFDKYWFCQSDKRLFCHKRLEFGLYFFCLHSKNATFSFSRNR
jgi:hypothetical protein